MADKDDRNPYSTYPMGAQGYHPYNAPGSPAHTSTLSTPSSPAFGSSAGASHAPLYRYPHNNHMFIGGKIQAGGGGGVGGTSGPGHAMQHSPQMNHGGIANYQHSHQHHPSHGGATSGGGGSHPVSSSMAGTSSGGMSAIPPTSVPISGPHHQKQMDSVLSSRQSASPHHHARVAAAAARSALSNPDAATNGANGNSSGGAGVDPNAKPSAWTILDLGGMQLKNLSASLFNYTFLTTLYLNHNALGLLSQEVAKLTSLVVLDLSGNRLTSLPSELGMLLSLKELLLHDNELTFLPPELGQLYQLDNLGLEGNPLNEPISSMIQKEGTSAVVTYLREMCPVGPPPPDREWISLEEDYAGDTKDTFTVMCYNILCEKYATPAMYAYTPSWALNWEYRRDLLLQDILNYNADIVLLQEMQMDQYEDFFRDQLSQIGGYEGVFYPKSRARTMAEYDRRQVDGCATFWKANKFSLLEKHCIEFQQTAMRKPELRKTDDVFNRVMIKDNVATVALLENKESKAKLLVSNAHLHWDPVYKDVKLVQTGMLMEEIETLCKSWGRTHGGASSTATKGGKSLMSSSPTSATSPTADSTRFPVLICGDFNSLPDSGVYEYLSGGRVDKDHSDFSHYVYGPYTSEGLSHHFSLKSAYSHLNTAACPGGELEFTNFAPGFKGTIDYVFYSTNSLEVTGLLSCVDKEYISRVVGLPNAHHPSDHLPLVVSLRAKPAVGANNGNSSSSVNQAAVAAAFANAGNASGGGGGKRIQ